MAKKARNTYYIISKSNWQSDIWMVEQSGLRSRKEGEQKIAKMLTENTGDIKNDRNFKVVSKSQLKKDYGIGEFDFHMYR